MSDKKNLNEEQLTLRRSSRSTRGSVKPVVNLTKQPELSEDEGEDVSKQTGSKKVIKNEKRDKKEEVLVSSSDDGDDDADFEVPTSKGRRSSATGARRQQSATTTKGKKSQSNIPVEKSTTKKAVASKTSISKKKSNSVESKKVCDQKQEDSISDNDNPAEFCYELNTNELKEVNNAFDLNCSQDGEELLSSDDLKTAIRSLGFEPRADEIQNLLKKFASRTGKINRDGFHKIMALKMGSSPGVSDKCLNDEISKVFNLLDLDKTGMITLENLRAISKELNEELTDEELHEMIVEADLDGDFQINKQEFYNIMKKTSLY